MQAIGSSDFFQNCGALAPRVSRPFLNFAREIGAWRPREERGREIEGVSERPRERVEAASSMGDAEDILPNNDDDYKASRVWECLLKI